MKSKLLLVAMLLSIVVYFSSCVVAADPGYGYHRHYYGYYHGWHRGWHERAWHYR
ncbi:MAG: hypothetical protein ACTHJ0_16895 [Flavipsychrobacter sp.]